MSVDAIAKLAHYTISLLADPLLKAWRARREVEANRIRARGQVDIMELLAVGEAEAELSARAVRELVEGSQSLVSLIGDEIEQRIESLFEKRLSNLAQIVGKARYCLPADEVPDSEPDMAWTSSFSSAAQDISSDDMQELWARILAGEVARQGSTSIRTLNVLRNLDQSTARLFRRLCSVAVSISLPEDHSLDHRVVSLGGNAAQNSLRDFGIGYDQLNGLNEFGLIHSEYNSWFDYRICIGLPGNLVPGRPLPLAFTFEGHSCVLIADVERDLGQEFRVSGVALTRAGREISKAVELEPVPKYAEALRDYFAQSGLRMVQTQGIM